MKDIRMKFGAKVKDLRISKGYSQEKLAELSDLDRTYIPGIESGKRNVSLVVIEKNNYKFQSVFNNFLKLTISLFIFVIISWQLLQTLINSKSGSFFQYLYDL